MSTEVNIASAYGKLKANIVITDPYDDIIVYASCFGTQTAVNDYAKKLSLKGTNIHCSGMYVTYQVKDSKMYRIFRGRVPNADYVHMIFCIKDSCGQKYSLGEYIDAFLLLEHDEVWPTLAGMSGNASAVPELLLDEMYEKFVEFAPCYVDKSWIPFLIKKMQSVGGISEMTCTYDKELFGKIISSYRINVPTGKLISYISEGLRNREISMGNEYADASSPMKSIAGLNGYLEAFPNILAEKILKSFVPLFLPGKQEYSETLKKVADYAEWHGHFEFFAAQKDVAQSVSEALKRKKAALIIGEMGAGKTAVSILSALTHNNDRKKMVNVVMCPSHLVQKWKREIMRIAPLSEVHIVKDFKSIIELRNYIEKTKREGQKRHIWLVLSKESAKLGYEEQPAVIWKYSKEAGKECYCCPECGEPIFWLSYKGKGRNREAIRNYLDEISFLKKNAKNAICPNRSNKKVWNDCTKQWKFETECGASLWQPSTKESDTWIKLGKIGWIEKKKVDSICNKLLEEQRIKDLKGDAREILIALLQYKNNELPPQSFPRKYPVAKYIRRFMKGIIDYFLCDEIHLVKSQSMQGEAFGDLVFAAKKTIGMTGTLLNGYASGIYYILYRLFARQMKRDGFEYSSPSSFVEKYGVIKSTTKIGTTEIHKKDKDDGKKTVKKEMPGISPLVFTKYLLENAAFIGLEDISDGLPGYKEIPMPVDMDCELENSYKKMEKEIRSNVQAFKKGGLRLMSQLLPRLTAYPDQPYRSPAVFNPDTGKVVCTPDDLGDGTRNKEQRFLDLVKTKVDAGEKVLVYYTMTGTTDLGDRLPRLLEEIGIKARTMAAASLGRSKYISVVPADGREQWIEKQVNDGLQVLICNPSLVETGLDLLDFTTIIFYQIGYNLFTTRQASRRSWRLSQDKDVEVYFMYYRGTVQENALSLMANKLQAAMAIEGKFSEEGLNAMSNHDDILSKVAASVVDGITEEVDTQVFLKTSYETAKKSFSKGKAAVALVKKEESKKEKHFLKEVAKKKIRMSKETAEILRNPYLLLEAV